MKEVKLKSGRTGFSFTVDELKEMDDNMQGACRHCGEIHDGVEPDATRYDCDACGDPAVYGAAEFAMRGWVH